MSVDISAVARVLGIDVQYKDLRGGGVTYLPQRIAVIAQGSSDASYSTNKFQATSAAHVGQTVGFGSPAHLIARQLLPPNGDGVGTIPVTIYPLEDDASAEAAEGAITPSGTQLAPASYRVIVGNVRSQPFVLRANADVSDACGAIYSAIQAVLEMPVAASIAYGAVTSQAMASNIGDGTLTAVSVSGTPTAGTYTLTCVQPVAEGGVFSLTDPQGGVVPGSITMTPGSGAASPFTVGGLAFTLTDGASDFAVGDGFTIKVPATEVTLTSKWKGASANGLKVVVEGPELGTVFAIEQPTGGLVNPDITSALAQFGTVWETLVINAQDIADTDTLNLLQEHGEGRWGQLVRKPYVAFTGNTAPTVGEAVAIPAARKTDRVNAQLVSPGSSDLPFVVAARQVARIAKMANDNPPTDYGAQRATGLIPGPDGNQWSYPERDQALKNGSSTIEVKDGIVTISDVVTFYHPTGEEPPAYRYVVDIIKLQNIIFNLDVEFSKVEWNGAPLIPDEQPTVNPLARKPKSAKAAVCALLDSLALEAIIADSKDAKASTTAVISAQNPKRLDVKLTVKLSGNLNIISVDLAFGFYFGVSAVAA